MQSIFRDKNSIPADNDLENSLAETYPFWKLIRNYICSKYPEAMEEWNYSGKGWSFRMKDKKRTIIYLLPREGFFKAAFVFGQKATDLIMASRISGSIKTELDAARVYSEGRGIRIDIKDDSLINDIKELINIKLAK